VTSSTEARLIDRDYAVARDRVITGGVIIGASLAAFAGVVWLSVGTVPGDFLVYRAAAQAAGHGADIYSSTPSSIPGDPFTYPPFAALALGPTTLLRWHETYLLWTATSMVVLGAVLARFVPAELRHRRLVLAAVIAASALTCVVTQNVRQGQINIFLMGLCLADLLRQDGTVFGQTIPRGVLVGVATAIKLTPGLFIIFFVVTGQWRLARGSVVGALGATLIAALIHPALTTTFFRTALWSLPDRVDLGHPFGYWANNSIDGAVTAIGPGAARLAVPAMIAFAVFALLAARRTYRAGRDADAWLIVGLAAPLISPFSWAHHLVYLLPALTTLALTRPWARRPSAIVGGVVILVVLHFGGSLGNDWLQTGNPWLFVPGGLMRESLVLVSIGSILALRAPHRTASLTDPQEIRVQPGSTLTAAVGVRP
jgi:alpha-1,2-mannosyltransferase